MADTDETSLPAAVDELYRAVGALVDDRKQFLGGVMRSAPSLYSMLLAEIPAKDSPDANSRGVSRSLPPAWCEALDLRISIDDRVRVMQPEGDGTPARLRTLAGRRWRPQDARQVREMAAEMQSWALAIGSLIEPRHVKGVSAPCPNCGRRWVYRNHAGETVRQPALQLIIEHGCTCQGCKSFWPPERFLFLVRLLGFDLPAGVTAPETEETPRP